MYVLTSGCAWRYLPETFGVSAATAHRPFTVWMSAFEAVTKMPYGFSAARTRCVELTGQLLAGLLSTDAGVAVGEDPGSATDMKPASRRLDTVRTLHERETRADDPGHAP
ncbi:hypothetical protein [Streptomyces sp. ID05-04B]|uniref:hypothetical protein n=1 Tax=Streptomyces sp. ID05-04B TaxID=3028661 RepID=UPI0039F72309